MYELTVKTSFAAAHKLRNYQGACARVHGHTWLLEVSISGTKLDSTGMLLDFKDLKQLVAQATGGLDHSYINELAPFTPDGPEGNPTAENLSRYIYKQVKKELAKGEYRVKMLKVRLWESPNASVTYWEE